MFRIKGSLETLKSRTEINEKEEANILNFLFMSGYQDSNLGPPAPKAGALTGLRYTPKFCCWRCGRDSNPRPHA